MTDDRLTVLDLFSGIGGFSLGLERTGGFRTVAFCERDPFCRAVLAKHWPGAPIHEDVRALRSEHVGAIDLVCGGFPCQPWSVAGQRRGATDDRDLWPEMRRLVAECRPRWVTGENVSGFVSQPMGLDRCLADLEAEGYQVGAAMVPACAVGAPHRRDRIWIVAHSDAAPVLGTSILGHEPDGTLQRHGVVANAGPQAGRRFDHGRREQQPEGGESTGLMADVGDSRRALGSGPPAERAHAAVVRDGWWDVEPDVGRMAHGVPRRVDRLRSLGNAVVPQVVEAIGRAILEAERDVSRDSSEARAWPGAAP